jgi:HemK-related putative methylase
MIPQFPIEEIKPQILEQLKNILKKNNYTHEYLLQIGVNPFAYDKMDLPLFAYRFPPNSTFGILFNLFFLGLSINTKSLEQLFSGINISYLIKINLLEIIGKKDIRSKILLTPYKNFYFASDFILQQEDRAIEKKEQKYEYVYPVSLDSVTLSESCLKKSFDKVLDVGCGSGVLGIIASFNSKQVVGIDINPRAVNFSRFNALLNKAGNCRFLCGDLYNPVKNEKFDLILSNPPYEIALIKSSLFQDGGKLGYDTLKKVIEGISNHLKKDGFAQIITKIPEFSDTNSEQLITKWISNNKLEVYFQELYSTDIYRMAYDLYSNEIFHKNIGINYRYYYRSIKKILYIIHKNKFKRIIFGIFTVTHASRYKYISRVIDSTNISASELPLKLQGLTCKHFMSELGLYGYVYFIRSLIRKNLKSYFPYLSNFPLRFKSK